MTTNKKIKASGNLSPDLSILKPQTNSAVNNILEVIKAYANGTSEMTNLLSNECDLLYECKVCRNIFRHLSNFITHKRSYCTQKCDPAPHQHNQTKEKSLSPDYVHIKNNVEFKSIQGGIRNIISPIHSEISSVLDNCKVNRLSVLNSNDDLNKKNEIISDVKPIIKEEVKSPVKNPEKEDNNNKGNIKLEKNEEIFENFSCKLCKKSFDSKRVLKIHISTAHNEMTSSYKCPSCPKTFLQPSTMTKHINNAHTKYRPSTQQLQEAIKKAQNPQEKIKEENSNNNVTNSKTLLSKSQELNDSLVIDIYQCSHCKKSFNTKSMLSNHSNICLSKFSFKETNGNSEHKQKKSSVQNSVNSEEINRKQTEEIIKQDDVKMEQPILKNKIKQTEEITKQDGVKIEQPILKNKIKQNEEITKQDGVKIDQPVLKRSVRNRTRKTFKDFILDLPPNIASPQSASTINRPTKRRHTVHTENLIQQPDEPPKEIHVKSPEELNKKVIKIEQIKIKNYAFQMANKAVESSRASFKIHPQIQKHNSDLELLSRKIPNIRRTSSKGGNHNLNNEVKKINTKTKINNVANGDVVVKCPTEEEFKQYLIKNRLTEPVKKVFIVAPEI